jgi:hypothetical protein
MFAPGNSSTSDPDRRARMQYNYLRNFADDDDGSKLPQAMFSYSQKVAPVQADMQHGPRRAPHYLGGGLHGNDDDVEFLDEQNSERDPSPKITAVADDEESVVV